MGQEKRSRKEGRLSENQLLIKKERKSVLDSLRNPEVGRIIKEALGGAVYRKLKSATNLSFDFIGHLYSKPKEKGIEKLRDIFIETMNRVVVIFNKGDRGINMRGSLLVKELEKYKKRERIEVDEVGKLKMLEKLNKAVNFFPILANLVMKLGRWRVIIRK